MNYKKSTLRFALFSGAAALLFVVQSCVKDNFELDKLAQFEYNPNLAAPLVYSSLTIQDMLNKNDAGGLVSVGSDNFCTLIYKGNLFTFVASDLIEIPNQTPPPFTSSLSAAQALALVPAGATVTVNTTQPVAFNSGTTGTKIDSVKFKQGDLTLSISSDFRNSGQIVLSIPSAKKNGIVFSKTIPINYTGTVPVNVSVNYDLTGYQFDMTSGGTTYNQFTVNADVSLTGTGVAPLTTDKITISQSIVNMMFDRIYGDIGQQNLSPNKDTVELSVFTSALQNGSFTLDDAIVQVGISNSYGVPIGASITQFIGYKPSSLTVPITGYPNPLPINSPTFSQIGQSITSNFTLNKTNSNIVSVINNLPNYLIYQINTQTNPAGGSTHSNFVLDSSKFKVDLEVELPLYGTAMGFTLLDTTDFAFEDEVNDIDWVLLRTYNSNGFPLDVNLQVYFTDTNYVVIDSLFKTQPILQSGIVNPATGKVTAPTIKTQDALFTKTQLNSLKNAKHLLIKAKANTANSGATSVKIYADYRLDVKIGVQVQINKKI